MAECYKHFSNWRQCITSVTYLFSKNPENSTFLYIVNVSHNSPYSHMPTVETSSLLLFKWFSSKFMKTNTDKSHPLLSCKRSTTWKTS